MQTDVYCIRWNVVKKVTNDVKKEGKGSPYSITEHRVPELMPILGSQLAGDVHS